jgi:hypothetical protein
MEVELISRAATVEQVMYLVEMPAHSCFMVVTAVPVLSEVMARRFHSPAVPEVMQQDSPADMHPELQSLPRVEVAQGLAVPLAELLVLEHMVADQYFSLRETQPQQLALETFLSRAVLQARLLLVPLVARYIS